MPKKQVPENSGHLTHTNLEMLLETYHQILKLLYLQVDSEIVICKVRAHHIKQGNTSFISSKMGYPHITMVMQRSDIFRISKTGGLDEEVQ